jgi:hypothetical protein
MGEIRDGHAIFRGESNISYSLRVERESTDNQLGAIRYERDVRGVANYLSTQTTFGGAREKFVRLQQISTVLNMDAVSHGLIYAHKI